MQWGDIFEPNPENTKAWERLPLSVREAIKTSLLSLQAGFTLGEKGRFRVTSGWRSDAANRKAGGAVDSRHLWGGAIDVVPVSPVDNDPPKICSLRFQVIWSGKCWHIQYR